MFMIKLNVFLFYFLVLFWNFSKNPYLVTKYYSNFQSMNSKSKYKKPLLE